MVNVIDFKNVRTDDSVKTVSGLVVVNSLTSEVAWVKYSDITDCFGSVWTPVPIAAGANYLRAYGFSFNTIGQLFGLSFADLKRILTEALNN